MTNQAQYCRISANEAQAMNRVLQMLLDEGDPASAIGEVIEADAHPEAAAFEQYASLTLSRAGGYRLTGARFAGALKVIQPNNGRLAQLVHSAVLPPSLETTVLATECALNRLICIADAIADGKAEGEPRNDAPRRSISILGGGFLSTNVGWRSSRVILPDMAALGGDADAVDLARNDSDDSPIAAIARLEELVDELEASLTTPADDASARPLYAANPFSRLAIGLLDDEFTVADQAQAFLQGDMEALPDKGKLPRYFRIPNALYHAHFGLSCLYQGLKNYTIAERHSDRCISLAPTTPGAYYRKADVLAENGWYAQAANVLITGLQTSAVSADCSLLYFHLGMLLWNLGEKSKAAAVHAYNASLQGEYAERSKKVIGALRERSDAPDAAHANPCAASHLLSLMNLPIAPVNLHTQIAQAAVTLANSGSPRAAAPYARQLERQRSSDEIVVAACCSIQFGITL